MENWLSSKKIKIIFIAALMVVGFCMVINTNNNPNALIQRVFRPIHFSSGSTLTYAGIIPLIHIYYSLKGIYEMKDFGILNSPLKRIIFALLIMFLFSTISQNVVKLYKSFPNDLNSVYCYRDNMVLSCKDSENMRELACTLDLENCSGKSQNFFVKVRLPDHFMETKLAPVISKESLTLYPHERRQFYVLLNESKAENANFSFSSIHDFEFALFNNSQEVRFACNDDVVKSLYK
jgi:hypothetical protein